MADYYTDVSFVVSLPPKPRAYLEELIDLYETYLPEELEDALQRGEINAYLAEDIDTFLDMHPFLGVDIEKIGTDLWFNSDESANANVDALGDLFHEVLRNCNCDEIIGFEWGNSCSKPVLDAFGGGACVVSKEGVEFMNTYTWMELKKEHILNMRKQKGESQ